MSAFLSMCLASVSACSSKSLAFGLKCDLDIFCAPIKLSFATIESNNWDNSDQLNFPLSQDCFRGIIILKYGDDLCQATLATLKLLLMTLASPLLTLQPLLMENCVPMRSPSSLLKHCISLHHQDRRG